MMFPVKFSQYVQYICNVLKHHRTYGCFKKKWYPQIIHSNRVFHHKPSILGYHYFWKHPFGIPNLDSKNDAYPIIYRVLTIPGGAGFLPSTVLCIFVCNISCSNDLTVSMPTLFLFSYSPKQKSSQTHHSSSAAYMEDDAYKLACGIIYMLCI